MIHLGLPNWLLLLFALTSLSLAGSGTPSIGVFVTRESPESRNIYMELEQAGFAVSLIEVLNLKKDPSFQCGNFTNVVAVGMTAISQALYLCNPGNVVAIESKANIDSIVSKSPFSSYYLEQSLHTQLEYATSNILNLHQVGVLYQDERELIQLRDELAGFEKVVVYHQIDPARAVADFIKLLPTVDGVLITQNSKIWNKVNMKGFLLSSVRERKIIIGGISEQFIKAGVFAGVFTDTKELGLHIANQFKDRVARPTKYGYFPVRYFRYNEFLANRLDVGVVLNKQ